MSPTDATIAIVDDDHSVRRALRRLLRSAGLRAETFSSGEEFLEHNVLDPCDCLVLDLRMPGMDGLEVLDRLSDAGIRTPVILITAHDGAEAAELGRERGVWAYLRKPFGDRHLLDAIHTALERNASEPAVA